MLMLLLATIIAEIEQLFKVKLMSFLRLLNQNFHGVVLFDLILHTMLICLNCHQGNTYVLKSCQHNKMLF